MPGGTSRPAKMYKHCRKQYNRWSFRLSIFGKYLDAGESYEDEISAGVAADLAKHHLRTEYRLDLPASLEGDMFSSLAYSRRSVDLNSSYSVEKALAPGVKSFIAENTSLLLAHKDSQPRITDFEKFRNSGMMEIPAVKEWVLKCEAAELEAKAFSEINAEFLFRLLDALPSRLTDVLKPLRLAVKMHDGVTNPKLVSRCRLLAALVDHLEQNLEYVVGLASPLRVEQAEVESAVATLEANRPSLA